MPMIISRALLWGEISDPTATVDPPFVDQAGQASHPKTPNLHRPPNPVRKALTQ